MKILSLVILMSTISTWAQSGRLDDKIQSEFGPEPTRMCHVGLLMKNGQVQMIPSRFLAESECIWLAKSKLRILKGEANSALLSHGNFQKEIYYSELK